MCNKVDFRIQCDKCSYPYSEAKYPDNDFSCFENREILEVYIRSINENKKPIEILESMKIKTVGELIDVLSGLDRNEPIGSSGPDCGGYDACYNSHVSLMQDENGDIFLTHLEYLAYCLQEKKMISYNEYTDLIDQEQS